MECVTLISFPGHCEHKIHDKIQRHLVNPKIVKSYLVKVLATTFTIATEIHMGEETA